MDFIHRHYQPGETIAAISTPPGEGGISIIRISGERAIEIADQIFSGNVKDYLTHTAHFGIVLDKNGIRLDEAILLLMRAPKSYTGEDTVELQCHGGMIASKKVLEAVLAAGARAAMPGEFTFKAYINGRLDLAQAEAVQKIISAKNEHAFLAAGKHLEGELSKKIEIFQEQLIYWTAVVEAWVDFPEEGLEFATLDQIMDELKKIQEQMEALVQTFEDGRRCDQGISLCIVGAPNVGKSSLMNALLGQERAIVTPIAGTTRDLLHEELLLGDLHFKLTDTAGIRDTDEMVEQEGIRRAKGALENADLILCVLDGSRALESHEEQLLNNLPKEKSVILWNKSDHPDYSISSLPFIHALSISAKEKKGLEALKKAITNTVWKNGVPSKDEVLISNFRQKEALVAAVQAIQAALLGLSQAISPEFLIPHLRDALHELGRIKGRNISEDIISSIFSQFCIGK